MTAFLDDVMRGYGVEWRDLRSQEKGLTLGHHHKGVGQLYLASSQCFHFPAHKRHAGLEGIEQVIFEPCTLVLRYGVVRWFFRFTFAHRRIIRIGFVTV